jgi:tetratricopeptide (TPR) repeat protein
MNVYYERARLLFTQGRHVHAERELRELLAENPNHGQAHSFLGRCLAAQKHWPEALVEGEKGVGLAPNLPYAHYMLGMTYTDCGRLEQAEGALREAMRLDPRNVEQLAWLSWIQSLRGDRRAALATAEQGLAINPEHVTCLDRKGLFLRFLGQPTESEEAIRMALRLAPENFFTHTNLGWTLLRKVQARSRLDPALQSFTLSWRPELREALSHFREAIRLRPAMNWAKEGVEQILLMRSKAICRSITAALAAIIVAFLFRSLGEARFSADNNAFFFNLFLAFMGIMAASWSSGPIYLLMRCGRLGAAVLPGAKHRAANVAAVCLAAAVIAAAVGLLIPLSAALGWLFAPLVIIRPVTFACETPPGRLRKVAAAYAALLAVGGLACAAAVGTALGAAAGVAGSIWIVAGAGKTPQVVQYLTARLPRKRLAGI